MTDCRNLDSHFFDRQGAKMGAKKNTTDNSTDVPTTSEAPRKLLVGKRVLRDFVVRSGLRTGMCNETGGDDETGASTCWCSRSRGG